MKRLELSLRFWWRKFYRSLVSRPLHFLAVTALALLLLAALVRFLRSPEFCQLISRPELEAADSGGVLRLDPEALFVEKPLVIWSTDYHISPIRDLKHLLRPLGVRFIDRSLSASCSETRTCRGRCTLRVLDQENAMDLPVDPPDLVRRFFDAYRDDEEMRSVDAIVCFHPTSMCELYMPFNKSLFVIASTRYELGRFDADRWARWNENLRRIADGTANVVGANNLYDVEYIRYFTGLRPQLLPSYCGYVPETYSPTRRGFLLAPIHGEEFELMFMSWWNEATGSARSVGPTSPCSRRSSAAEAADGEDCSRDAELIPVRTLYPRYEYSDLVAHQGIVHVPYQVSVMSLFEQYRMNIPLFFPSEDLLASWQHHYMVMSERTWDGISGKRAFGSKIRAHASQEALGIPDPNNEQDFDAIRHWIRYADFYQLPHVIYYASVDDLRSKLTTMTASQLRAVSDAMHVYNRRAKRDVIDKWKRILLNVAKHSPNRPH